MVDGMLPGERFMRSMVDGMPQGERIMKSMVSLKSR